LGDGMKCDGRVSATRLLMERFNLLSMGKLCQYLQFYIFDFILTQLCEGASNWRHFSQ